MSSLCTLSLIQALPPSKEKAANLGRFTPRARFGEEEAADEGEDAKSLLLPDLMASTLFFLLPSLRGESVLALICQSKWIRTAGRS
ncbi:hypothetical protein ACLOJK_022690, partial [Asimina triloba]